MKMMMRNNNNNKKKKRKVSQVRAKQDDYNNKTEDGDK